MSFSDTDGTTPTATQPIDADSGVVPALVDAVAAVENTHPTALPPLGATVDTDALTALTESTDSVRIRFEYVGHDVVVTPERIELY